MLAASIRREVHLGNILPTRMQSRVPRCLFGPPNPKETVELLQEALDMERSRFMSRWGVDPHEEDKENFQIIKCEGKSPRKSRSIPYNKQTSIHDARSCGDLGSLFWSSQEAVGVLELEDWGKTTKRMEQGVHQITGDRGNCVMSTIKDL
ncbi:uncharacterized protein [Fopius arisanus]|uniref:Tgt-2_0 protein n=1 Tax=Fopius arisanus TaxID=64838 RepID=A0A0C9RRS0_9HYME|nr:PREDICTED: uncharacterized protein LOC105267253 isoform X1 [Fopius arisanus]